MNKQGYVNIMKALVNLLVVIMVEAGKVPIATASKLGQSLMRTVTGGTTE